MPFSQQNGIRYFQFKSLKAHHAIFTRQGGVSPHPWSSLNMGGNVGDERDRVRSNRLLSFEMMGCHPESIHDSWLVHGTDVIYVTSPHSMDAPAIKADILLTDQPDITLFMRFADCVPILVYDPRREVIGIAHAGWLGTVRDVAGETIRSMHKGYGVNPSDVVACIGPSIGPDHYQVKEDVIEQAMKVFGSDVDQVLHQVGDNTYFNLWSANRILLQRAGVSQIEISEICTACHLDDWYSHRGEKGKTGRFGALVSLK